MNFLDRISQFNTEKETRPIRAARQGFSPDEQYVALNAAREKRKNRKQRNLKQLIAGGHQIPLLLNGNSPKQ